MTCELIVIPTTFMDVYFQCNVSIPLTHEANAPLIRELCYDIFQINERDETLRLEHYGLGHRK